MGYNDGGRWGYWAKVGEILKRINDKDILIWGPGSNGEVSRRNKCNRMGIRAWGNWTLSEITESWEGIKLVG